MNEELFTGIVIQPDYGDDTKEHEKPNFQIDPGFINDNIQNNCTYNCDTRPNGHCSAKLDTGNPFLESQDAS